MKVDKASKFICEDFDNFTTGPNCLLRVSASGDKVLNSVRKSLIWLGSLTDSLCLMSRALFWG